jgi:peptidoglycan/LPS O-acetylase OafA/YrhL
MSSADGREIEEDESTTRQDELWLPLGHLRPLDGIRGLAVMAVILYHLFPDTVPGGFLGVTVFFVLSGYLITTILITESHVRGRIDLANFWKRRLRRLLPAGLLGIALAILVGQWVGDAEQLRTLPGDVFGAATYTVNWHFISQGLQYGSAYQQPSVVQHYWSLAIEEQFYAAIAFLAVAMAAIIARVGRLRFAWGTAIGLLAIGSLAVTFAMGPARKFDIYLNTTTRAVEILIGSFLAVLLVGRSHRLKNNRSFRHLHLLGWLATLLLILLFASTDLQATWLYRGGFVGVAFLTAIVIVAVHLPSSVARSFGSPPLVAVGLISYGIYVYHWPLFILISEETTSLRGLWLALARIVATVAISLTSYRLVEMPIRNGLFRGHRVLAVMVTVPAIVMLPLAASIVGSGAERRSITTAPSVENDWRFTLPTDQYELPKHVVLIGDSILHDTVPAFRNLADSLGISVTTLGGPGQTLFDNRDAWMDQMLSAVESVDPDVVVLDSSTGSRSVYTTRDGRLIQPDDPDYWVEWELESRELTRIAGSSGARVYLVIPPPVDGVSSKWYGDLVTRMQRVTENTKRLLTEDPQLGLIDWRVVGTPDGGYTAFFPTDSDSAVEIRAKDGTHFTPAGSNLLAETTMAQLLHAWKTLSGRP